MGQKNSRSSSGSDCGEGASAAGTASASQQQQQQQAEEVKVLLLGIGEAGKSTFFRQVEFLFGRRDEASSPDLAVYRPMVREQLLRNLAALLRVTRALGPTALPDSQSARETADAVADAVAAADERERALLPPPAEPLADALTPVLGAGIARLWADAGMQRGFEKARRGLFDESLAHFFGEAERLSRTSYVPTRADVMHLRASTTGISEAVFGDPVPALPGKPLWRFRIVDVGGQRSERKKWLRHFETVDVVVFFAGLNSYDLRLFEDATRRCIDESLAVWADICRNPSLAHKPTVLLLNKEDLFAAKLSRVPLKDHVHYVGPPTDVAAATACIRGMYDKVRRDLALPPAASLTCSVIDPSSAESAFLAVRNLLVEQHNNQQASS